MQHYELCYLIGANTPEDKIAPISQSIEKILNDHEAEITFKESWDRRRLAYPVKHQYYGYYCIAKFDLEKSAQLKSLHHQFRVMAEILRFQIVKTKKKTQEEIEKEKMLREKRRKEIEEEKIKTKEKRGFDTRGGRDERKEYVKKETHEPMVQEKLEEKKPGEKPKVTMEELDKKLDEILDDTKGIL